MASTPFKLSASLFGHTADVRSLSSSTSTSSSRSSSSSSASSYIASGSRDGTARIWTPPTEGQAGEWTQRAQLDEHDGFVSAVKSVLAPDGSSFVVSGGQDKLVYVSTLDPSMLAASSGASAGMSKLVPERTLIGHSDNVVAIDCDPQTGRIVTGSWDKSVRVWQDGQVIHELHGHEQAVWAVLAWRSSDDSDSDLVVSASADTTVRVWQRGKCLRTLKGHSQAVRALARLGQKVGGGALFASAGNDASIRIWTLDGDTVSVLNGHDSFIYSLATIPDEFGGGLVSGGEDRSIKIWRGDTGECEQTITVPATSVWTVDVLSNGDIAAGSSDGVIRIFSRDSSRHADAPALKQFEDEVSSTAINAQSVGDVKKSDLPGTEALLQPGKKEGEVRMIKTEDNKVEAHQWSNATGGWTKIGDVVDAVGSGRKQLYEGREWDYVFDVDIQDGVPPLKLPFNANESPYAAAQRFLLKHELPLTYIDQVVEFIDKNAGGVSLGATGGANGQYVDPFTGASRYQSNGSGGAAGSSGSSFTGDPFTGGGYGGPQLLPHRSHLNFTQANLAALKGKVEQLTTQLSSDPSTSEQALTADELSTLSSLVSSLEQALKGGKGKALAENEVAVAVKMLGWPYALRFPAIDLARVLLLSSTPSNVLSALVAELTPPADAGAKERETNTMLALRGLANAFTTAPGRRVMRERAPEILPTLARVARQKPSNLNKNGAIALATVALDYSILAAEQLLDAVHADALIDTVNEVLVAQDSETVYRGAMALGNLLVTNVCAAKIPGDKRRQGRERANKAAKASGESRMKAVVAEIERRAW